MDTNSSPGTPLGDLERRLIRVRKTMNCRGMGLNLSVDDALSEYRATTPPMFLWDPRLSAAERTLAGVHELIHAVLHTPGSPPFGKNETPVEERIAHYVAGRACAHFGVDNYPDFVEHWHLLPTQIEVDEQAGAELLLAAVIETLETPEEPAWLGRGNFSFGIESLERAWNEA